MITAGIRFAALASTAGFTLDQACGVTVRSHHGLEYLAQKVRSLSRNRPWRLAEKVVE